jgi:predicted phosphoribosyltransferase
LRRYRDRADAGRALGERLRHLAGEDVVVLGAPRGGVVVAEEVARALGAPLDVVLVRKLPLPFARETAFGVIGEDGHAIVDEALVAQLRLDPAAIERTKEEVLDVIREEARAYRAVRPPEPIEGRVALLVDDGLATGYTMLGAAQWARARRPSRLVLAAPVSSDSAEQLLRPHVDELVCPVVDPGFVGVSAYYERFDPVDDEGVVEALRTVDS